MYVLCLLFLIGLVLFFFHFIPLTIFLVYPPFHYPPALDLAVLSYAFAFSPFFTRPFFFFSGHHVLTFRRLFVPLDFVWFYVLRPTCMLYPV